MLFRSTLTDGTVTGLARPEQFVGYRGATELETVLLCNHGLHVELHIDRHHPVDATHPAGLRDVVLEAAISTILDGEDSVAVVDGPDKAGAFRNLAGLFRGDLTATFAKAAGP